MFKKSSFAWVMSPLLMASFLFPQVSWAQRAPSPGTSGGTSGSNPTGGSNTIFGVPSPGTSATRSGSNPTGGSNTVFGVPVTITAPGAGGFQPVSGSLTVTPGADGQPPTISISSPTILAAVNAAGTNAVIIFSTGTLTQQQIAILVSAVATEATTLQATVPVEIVVSTLTGSETLTTLGEAFTALSDDIGNVDNIPNGAFSLQVGTVEVVINPRQ